MLLLEISVIIPGLVLLRNLNSITTDFSFCNSPRVQTLAVFAENVNPPGDVWHFCDPFV